MDEPPVNQTLSEESRKGKNIFSIDKKKPSLSFFARLSMKLSDIDTISACKAAERNLCRLNKFRPHRTSGLVSSPQAGEQRAGRGVLAAKRPRGPKGGTPPDGLQRAPERGEHAPGGAGHREGQVALDQGETPPPPPPHTHTV